MRHSKLSVLVLVLVLCLVFIPCLAAQAKKDATTGEDRLEGTIQSISKDTSTITLRQTNKTVTWQIVFDKNTKITFRNKDGAVDQLKDGVRVICLGKFGEKNQMKASRIDIRTEK